MSEVSQNQTVETENDDKTDGDDMMWGAGGRCPWPRQRCGNRTVCRLARFGPLGDHGQK
jgi:hypothetical protein